MRDAVQPTREGFGTPDPLRLASEYEERRLECILGVVRIMANAAARPKDGFRVPANEQFECGRIAAVKPLEQIAIGYGFAIELRNSG